MSEPRGDAEPWECERCCGSAAAMSDRDRLAELLALHRLRLQARPKRDDAVAARCKCGVVIAYTGPPYEKRDELRHRIQLEWEQHLADALIAAGVTMPGVTEREKARACWCEKVLKRGLFGTEWKCCLRAGHDGECR